MKDSKNLETFYCNNVLRRWQKISVFRISEDQPNKCRNINACTTSQTVVTKRDRVSNTWATMERTLNLSDDNDDYSMFLFKYWLHFIYCVFL